MKKFKLFLKDKFPGLIYKYLEFRNPARKHKIQLLSKYNIDCVLDVGANIGLYGHAIRHSGFKGQIISFEPLSEPYNNSLKNLASKDPNWSALNYALGDYDGTAEINISDDSVSSSILEKTNKFNEMLPSIHNIKKETILIKKLDTVFQELCPNKKVFLKIDAQGFERNIITGASDSLHNIHGLQLELSVKQLYSEEPLYLEMLSYVSELGYQLKVIEEGWYNDSEIVQFDAIFFKDDAHN